MPYMRVLFSLLVGLLIFPLLSPAQHTTRSGLTPPEGKKPALRQFPCGGTTLLDENFDKSADTIPAGWNRLDLDQFVPRDEILFLTAVGGWQNVYDFRDPDSVNRLMASPSWYKDTVASSNDYLISPKVSLPISTCLSWYAYSQDPGFGESYEVLISTSTPDSAGFAANPALLVVDEEGDEFTYRSVSLAEYGEQDVYIAFRHTSTNKFILAIDDVRLAEVGAFDIAMFSVDPVAVDTIGDSTTFKGAIVNRGLEAYTFDSAELKISFQINNEAVQTIQFDTTLTLLPNDTLQFSHDSTWKVDQLATFRVAFWASGFGVDDIPANDTLGFFIAVGVPTGIGQFIERKALSVYPNPSNSLIQWDALPASAYPFQLRLIDLQGREVLARKEERIQDHSLDLTSLANGLYLLSIEGANGQMWISKVQKR